MPIYSRHLWRSVENGGQIPGPIAATTGHFLPTFFDHRLNPSLLQVLSIGLVVATPDARPKSPAGVDLLASGDLDLVYTGADAQLMQVKGALPRAFLSAAAQKIDDPNSVLAVILAPGFNPRQRIVVSGDVDAPLEPLLDDLTRGHQPATGTTRIIIDRANRVAIEVDASQAAILQFNDTWAPGWRATVNGVSARVYRSNLSFRAVVVPAGRSRVEFRYRPASVLSGAALAAAGVVFTLALGLGGLIAARKRRRNLQLRSAQTA
jgi:hypothetical protein